VRDLFFFNFNILYRLFNTQVSRLIVLNPTTTMMFTITLCAVHAPISGVPNNHSLRVRSHGLVAVSPEVSSISFAISYVPLPLYARFHFKVHCMQIGQTGLGKILNQPLIDIIIPDIVNGSTIDHIASFLQKLIMVDCGLWYQYESHVNSCESCIDINKWASIFTNFSRVEQVHVQQLDNILAIRKITIPQNACSATSMAASAIHVGPQPYPDKTAESKHSNHSNHSNLSDHSNAPQPSQAKLTPQNVVQSFNPKSSPTNSVTTEITEEYRDGSGSITPLIPSPANAEPNNGKEPFSAQKRKSINAIYVDQTYHEQPSFKKTLVTGKSSKPFYGDVISTSTLVDLKVGPGLSTSFRTSVSTSSHESSVTNNIQINGSVTSVTSTVKNDNEEEVREPFGELINFTNLFEFSGWDQDGDIGL
jgi:hypothetical protein